MMISPEALRRHCRQIGVTEEGIRVIEDIVNSPPSRRLVSRVGNVRGEFPSAKMGRMIGFESRRGELAACYALEHAPDVIAYYEQPPKIVIPYRTASGRALRVPHTPDFFVVWHDRAGWVECKPLERLIDLIAKQPGRFQQHAGDRFVCGPGIEYARPYGLHYEVLCTSHISSEFQRNYRFISDYHHYEGSPPAADVDKLLGHARQHPGCPLSELVAATGVGIETAYVLIARSALTFEMRKELLLRPDRCHIFADAPHMSAYGTLVAAPLPGDPVAPPLVVGATVIWGERSYAVIASTDGRLILHAPDNPHVELSAHDAATLLGDGKMRIAPGNPDIRQSPAYRLMASIPAPLLAAGLARARLIAAGEDDDLGPRAVREVRRRMAIATADYGMPELGAVARHHLKGNRHDKIDPKIKDRAMELLVIHYETANAPTKATVFRVVRDILRSEGIEKPPSTKTLARLLDLRPRAEQVRKRKGRKEAYGLAHYHWYLSYGTPPHGDRSLEVVHVDHQLLKLVCVTEDRLRELGQAWLTVAMDAYSRYVLAFYISFDSPSAYTLVSILRIIVAEHRRLPQVLVHDNGPEFESNAFLDSIALEKVQHEARPPAQPRHGSVLERLFGTGNRYLIGNMVGSTKLRRAKGRRAEDKAMRPEKLALWPLTEVYAHYEEFRKTYHQIVHPALRRCPADLFAHGLRSGGLREHRYVADPELYNILTLPLTKDPTRLVGEKGAIKVDHMLYGAEGLRALVGTNVAVRYDPDDISHVYAQDAKRARWIECRGPDYERFREHGLTAKQRQIASAELRVLDHGPPAKDAANHRERMLARLFSATASTELRLQRERDEARKRALGQVNGGNGSSPKNGSQPPGAEGNGTIIKEVIKNYRHTKLEDLK